MSTLRALVVDVRRATASSALSVSDAEIARTIGDVCGEMIAEPNKAGQREWYDEIVARAVVKLQRKVTVQ